MSKKKEEVKKNKHGEEILATASEQELHDLRIRFEATSNARLDVAIHENESRTFLMKLWETHGLDSSQDYQVSLESGEIIVKPNLAEPKK